MKRYSLEVVCVTGRSAAACVVRIFHDDVAPLLAELAAFRKFKALAAAARAAARAREECVTCGYAPCLCDQP